MKNEKHGRKMLLIVLLGLLLVGILITVWFRVDFGINSEYHIRQNFETAFTARQTGNCDVFAAWVMPDFRSDWRQRCLDEKNSNGLPIVAFDIQKVTITGNRAFLLVELQRSNAITEKIEPYSVNYEMRRIREGIYSWWIINQPVQK